MLTDPPRPQGLIFDTETPGQTQTWTVRHRGLEYIGQVIVTESVDPSWGRPLAGDLSFRLVFYLVPRRIPAGQIQDPRIAMAVPRREPAQARYLGRELRAVREVGERYVTARDRDARAMRSMMGDRDLSLRGELAQRYAVAYSLVRIYTYQDTRIRPRDIFSEESPISWADRLASAVLSHAHPDLPIDDTGFPGPLTGDKVAALYRGLFQDDSAVAAITRDYGPGLGLTRREAPALFDASHCPAVDFIRREVESRGGEMSGRELASVLVETYGLTPPLDGLYLMSFVRHARAEVELGPGHRVETRRGGPFLGDRFTWDMVPEVAFSEALADQVETVRLSPRPTWDSVLPYATLMVDGLEPGGDTATAAAQGRHLLDALGGLVAEIKNIRVSLDKLQPVIGEVPSDVTETLDGLEALYAVSDHQEFYNVAQDRFKGPRQLGEGLDLQKRLVELAVLASTITRVKSYLDSMSCGKGHQQLSIERDAVLARIEPGSLIANPGLWSSIEERFQQLRVRYATAYLAHHSKYHQGALELRRRLEGTMPQVEALAQFNRIPELGEPVGAEVPQQLAGLRAALRECAVVDGDPYLNDQPHCAECALPLDEDIPRREEELLFGAVERAMREYIRRLGSHGVRQVLAHPDKEQLEKFVNLVQVADPSSLANVLDDEVVGFLRQFLREG